MQYCEYCERAFKTVQGLLGHYRMKHNVSNGQYSAEYRPSTEERAEMGSGERRPSEERHLLESILDRLDELLAKQAEHHHGMADPHCPGCNEVVRQSLQKIRDEYESTPGVKRLVEMREQLMANGGSFEGWTPGAIAAADRGEDVITIE